MGIARRRGIGQVSAVNAQVRTAAICARMRFRMHGFTFSRGMSLCDLTLKRIQLMWLDRSAIC